MHPAVELIRRLPLQERLQVVQELWDDIHSSTEDFPIPPEQVAEAVRRLDELRAHPEMAITEDELWRRIDEKRGS